MQKWLMYCEVKDCPTGLEIEVPDELTFAQVNDLKIEGKFKFYCTNHKSVGQNYNNYKSNDIERNLRA